MKNNINRLQLIALTILLIPFYLQGQSTYDWTGATSADLTVSGNWGTGTVPTGADIAQWNAASYTTAPNALSNLTIGQMLFGGSNTAGVTFGSGASTITLNGVSGTGIQMNSGSGAVSTGSAKFALGASQTWTNNSANNLTIAGTITNSGNTTPMVLTIGGSGTTTASGVISNGGTTGTLSFVKSGSGTFSATNASNSYTGSVTVLQGVFSSGVNSSSPIILGDTTGSNTAQFKATTTLGGPITVNSGSTGTKTLGTLNTSTAWAVTGPITLNDSLTIANSSSGTATISGAISGSGAISINPANQVSTTVLSGANSYTGRTTVSGNQILSVSSINSVVGGTATSNMGAPITVANGTIALGGTLRSGQLTYTGTGETTDRVVNLAGTTGGAVLDQSGTGALKFTSSMTATGAGVKTLTLQGSTTGTGEIAGAIVDNSGTNKTALTKLGTGRWTLSGTSTYTGATQINAGSLFVNGSLAAGSAVSVAAGATLGGTGIINGAVTTASNTSVIDPASGTLTLGSLDATNGGEFKFTLGSDLLSVTGLFTGSTVAGNLKLTLDAGLVGTTYTLANFGSSLNLSDTSFSLSATSLAAGYQLDTAFGGGDGILVNGNNVQFQFSQVAAVPEPSTYLLSFASIIVIAFMRRQNKAKVGRI